MFPALVRRFGPTPQQELRAMIAGCEQLVDDLRSISRAAPSEVSFLYVQDVTEEAVGLLEDLRRLVGVGS